MRKMVYQFPQMFMLQMKCLQVKSTKMEDDAVAGREENILARTWNSSTGTSLAPYPAIIKANVRVLPWRVLRATK